MSDPSEPAERTQAPAASDPVARRRRIFRLALPIIGGMISQNVLNLVDTGMVGSLGVDAALAGVGLGSFLNFLLTAMILGLGAGVQAMAARRKGEERLSELAVPLNGALVISLLVGGPLSLALVVLAPRYFPWVSSDPAVLEQGVPYLQARLVAMVAMGFNYSFRGYWNAIDRSALYMSTLVAMHASNIGLNWVLIYGNLGAPALGATGAGLASAAATWIGVVVYFGLGFRHARDAGFLAALPDRATLRAMVKLAIPVGVQNVFFAGGMTVLMTIVGRVGTQELAAMKVIHDLMLMGILPGLGFGIAAASLVGQALGRCDPDDAERWGWDVVKLGAPVVGLVALPAVLVPELVLGVFLHEPATLALAVEPLRLVALSSALDAAGMILLNAQVGAGATRAVMGVSIAAQWGGFLPAAFLIGPVLGGGLTGIVIAQVVYRSLVAVVFIWLWRRGAWRHVKLA